MLDNLIAQLESQIRTGDTDVAFSIMAALAPEILLHKNRQNFTVIIAALGASFKNEPEITYLKKFYIECIKNKSSDLLEKYSYTSKNLIEERYHSLEDESYFDAILAEPIPYTEDEEELNKWKYFFVEFFEIEGDNGQLKKLFIFDNRVWLLVVDALLTKGFEKTSQPQFKSLLVSILKIDPLRLKNIYQHVSPQTFHEIISAIFVENPEVFTAEELNVFNQYVLSEYNIGIFNLIRNHLISYYQAPLPSLSLHQTKTIEILERCSLSTCTKLQNLIQQLTRGLGMIRPEYDCSVAPFVLAVVRQDKLAQYQYLPTMVFEDVECETDEKQKKEEEGFLDYLALLFVKNSDVDELFLHAPRRMSDHWRSGKVEIRNQSMKLFIVNSLGGDEFDLIKGIAIRFPEKQITIYYSEIQRQHSELGCSVFSLDDVRHLKTFTQYTQQGLFEQLEQRIAEEDDPIDNIRIFRCSLPLTLMRTMQSKKIGELVKKEMDDIVTKPKFNDGLLAEKGFTNKESIISGFIIDPETGKNQNKRIEHKLQKMYERLNTYIVHNLYEDPEGGFAVLEDLAREHTFPAFKHRAIKQSKVSKQHSSDVHEQGSPTLFGKRSLQPDPNDSSSNIYDNTKPTKRR